MLRDIRYRIEFVIVWLLGRFIQAMPRNVFVAFSRFIGTLAYYLYFPARKVGFANLDLAFGNTKSREEKRGILMDCFRLQAESALELFWMSRINSENALEYFDFDPEGLKRWQEIEGKHPIILIGLHYANWEWINALPYKGFKFNCVAKRLYNPYLDKLIYGIRSRSGNNMLYSASAVRHLLKCLKNNEIAALIIDQHVLESEGGIWVRFFNQPVLVTRSIATMALRTNAKVFGGYCRPRADGKFCFYLSEELTAPLTEDYDRNLQVLTQVYTSFCERVIREVPEPWSWIYKRWKFYPTDYSGDMPFYAKKDKPPVKVRRKEKKERQEA